MMFSSALARFLVVSVVGLAAGAVLIAFAPWQLAVLGGWDVAAGLYVGSVWLTVGRFTAEQTAVLATREDTSRVLTSVLLLSASVASLGGTGFDLVKASHANTSPGRVVLTMVGLLTVALSWSLVQTVFSLRYAHEYYTPPVGGIDFKSHEHPDYLDFAYVSFTIGMTFQVSDTDIQSHKTRRTVLRHALLAYLFGAVILAVVVNVIATLLN
jgi:uncharacterized membrane protein